MASLDFVTDLTDKLSKQNIDFIVITVQVGKPHNYAHIFHSLNHPSAIENFAESLVQASRIIAEKADEYFGPLDPEAAKPKKKRKKKGGNNDESSGS